MSYEDLIYSVEDGIATITLNRPARLNALSPNLEEELHRALDEADNDRAVRVIILTGSGAAFCGTRWDLPKCKKEPTPITIRTTNTTATRDSFILHRTRKQRQPSLDSRLM